MNTTPGKRLIWLVAFAALVALGTRLWLAHARCIAGVYDDRCHSIPLAHQI
jgi:hypothetical protein